MGWAQAYIQKLQAGETVDFRPRGNSMQPRIRSGQWCRVEPVIDQPLKVGDVVLCRVLGTDYLHLIKAVQGDRYQIGNNRGGINGWVTRRSIYGLLIERGSVP